LESFSGNSGSRWTSDYNGIDLLLSVALGFEKGSIVSLPVFIDSTSFDMILIEEGNDSIISFLDRLILSSDVYLYCLASNKQDCPSHFQVIQVNIIKRIDSRVLRRYDHEQSQCYIVL